MSYHPLHTVGEITLLDIYREKGHCGVTETPSVTWTLKEMAEGLDGESLNLYNHPDIIARIQKTTGSIWETTNYKLSDWYGYNHNLTVGETYEEQDFGTSSSLRNLYQLENSKLKKLYFEEIYLDGAGIVFPGIDKWQISLFNETRGNDSDISTTVYDDGITDDTMTIYCGVEYDTRLLSFNENVTQNHTRVRRGVLRVNIDQIQTSKTIGKVEIYLTGVDGTPTIQACLATYFPNYYNSGGSYYMYKPSVGNWFYDRSHYYSTTQQASDAQTIVNGATTFTLNRAGITHLHNCKQRGHDAYFLILLDYYDYTGNYHWGTNLVTGDDATMGPDSHWHRHMTAVPSGANFTVTDNVTPPIFLGHSDCLHLQLNGTVDTGSSEGLCAVLDHNYISGWPAGVAPSYTEASGRIVSYYTFKFDYKWVIQQPKDGWLTLTDAAISSHIRVNGDGLGMGLIDRSEFGLFNELYTIYDGNPNNDPLYWGKFNTAIHSENITSAPSTGVNAGIAIYLVYWSKTRDYPDYYLSAPFDGYNLMVDNFGIYKTYFSNFMTAAYRFNTTANQPVMKIYYDVSASVPTMDPITPYNITQTSAYVGATNIVSDSTIVYKGLVIAQDRTPSLEDYDFLIEELIPAGTEYTQDISFTVQATGLSPGKGYYVRAFAMNWYDTYTDGSRAVGYSTLSYFETLGVTTPIVTTTKATNITSSSATIGGEVKNIGSSACDARGIVYSYSVYEPSVGFPNCINDPNGSGIGVFSENIGGLNSNSPVYYRAYAHNASGYGYGTANAFTTTAGLPSVEVYQTTAESYNGAIWIMGRGDVLNNGGSSIISKGFCWSTTNHYPTLSDTYLEATPSTGDDYFTQYLWQYIQGGSTVYYIRSYATNASGTGYSPTFVIRVR